MNACLIAGERHHLSLLWRYEQIDNLHLLRLALGVLLNISTGRKNFDILQNGSYLGIVVLLLPRYRWSEERRR